MMNNVYLHIAGFLICASIVLFGIYLIAVFSIFEYEKISVQRSMLKQLSHFRPRLLKLDILFKPKKKQLWLLSLDTFVIVFLYIVLMTYLYIKK